MAAFNLAQALYVSRESMGEGGLKFKTTLQSCTYLGSLGSKTSIGLILVAQGKSLSLCQLK
jgi:hypothetical protein